MELRENGTFLLRFPPPPSSSSPPPISSRDDLGASGGDGGVGGSGSADVGHADAGDDAVDGIWTFYDPEDKRHWLAMKRGSLAGRYLLQDNLRPAWHTDRLSAPERVGEAVDEMIRRMKDHEK